MNSYYIASCSIVPQLMLILSQMYPNIAKFGFNISIRLYDLILCQFGPWSRVAFLQEVVGKIDLVTSDVDQCITSRLDFFF